MTPNLVRRSNKTLISVEGAALLNHLTTVRWQEECISLPLSSRPTKSYEDLHGEVRAVSRTSTIQTESHNSIPGIDIDSLVFVTSYKYSEGQPVSHPGHSGVKLLGGQES